MNAKAFLELVDLMRQAQRNYFATRDYRYYKEAKALEKRVDNSISVIKNELANGKIEQLTFDFG